KSPDILRFDAELLCKLFDGRAFNQARRFQFARDGRHISAQAASDAVFERKGFRRRNVIAVKAPALSAFVSFTPARGVASATTTRASATVRRRRDVCDLRRGRFARSPAALGTRRGWTRRSTILTFTTTTTSPATFTTLGTLLTLATFARADGRWRRRNGRRSALANLHSGIERGGCGAQDSDLSGRSSRRRRYGRSNRCRHRRDYFLSLFGSGSRSGRSRSS